MRKLVVSVLTSLDGYYEVPGKDLAPMPFEDASNTHNLTLLRSASTRVYGRTPRALLQLADNTCGARSTAH